MNNHQKIIFCENSQMQTLSIRKDCFKKFTSSLRGIGCDDGDHYESYDFESSLKIKGDDFSLFKFNIDDTNNYLLKNLFSSSFDTKNDVLFLKTLIFQINDKIKSTFPCDTFDIFASLQNKNALVINELSERSVEIKSKIITAWINDPLFKYSKNYQFDVSSQVFLKDNINSLVEIFVSKMSDLIAHSKSKILSQKKFCPILIGKGSGGIFIHEIIGHLLEHPFSNQKLIEENKISEILTVIDDPLIENGFGNISYDDNGMIPRKKILIQNGKVQQYLDQDRNRRENFKFKSSARMTNTFALPGKSSFSSLLSSIDDGIYLEKTGRACINPKNGNFIVEASQPWQIKNGKISYRLAPFHIRDNFKNFISGIQAISNNFSSVASYCLEKSGSIPVSYGQPDILVKKLNCEGSIV